MKIKILILFLFGAFLLSCNDINDDIETQADKLYLPTILSGDGLVITLTYDNLSRIVQLGEVADNGEFARLYTFYYTGDKLTSAHANYFSIAVEGGYNYSENFKFEYVDDKVLIEESFLDSSGYEFVTNKVIYIDERENLLKGDGLELFYDERGNIIKAIENGNVTDVSYDQKKGAFLNVKTPTWALYYIMKLGNFYRINNPIRVHGFLVGTDTEIEIMREFKYNGSGYPVKFSEVTTDEDDSITNRDFIIEYLRIYED